jgi:uncharacterized protein (TIGR00299 family) protein
MQSKTPGILDTYLKNSPGSSEYRRIPPQPDSVLVYDCFSGISGDMHIGAMLDIGVPFDYLAGELAKLSIAEEFELIAERDTKMGISGTRATIRLKQTPHCHRHLTDIKDIVQTAGYADPICARALDIFQHLAAAEAKIHNTSIAEVHFHEVGATDSIADIVAAALCLEYLQVDRVFCSALELGGGMVQCAHGHMPVPAPATIEILKGVCCRYGGIQQETITPTGAAILKHAVHQFSAPKEFITSHIGYGLGHKDFAIPNVLRVQLGHLDIPMRSSCYEIDHNREIQCNIDDMSPEAFQPLLDLLFEAGAKDVFLTPIVMKKSRPGTKLTILATPAQTDPLLQILFRHSTTIGVRIHDVEKMMLPREVRRVQTRLGEVSVKIVQLPHGGKRWKLEHEEVLTLATRHNRSYLEVRDQLNREIACLMGNDEPGTCQQ